MKNKLLLSLLFALGCGKPVTVITHDIVITNMNGRILRQLYVDRGEMNYPHFIYYFEDAPNQPVSVNYSHGKHSQVIVIFNGKTNILENP